MRDKKKKTEGGGKPKVPAYIVTYSDMITLLLTFFVMLLSLASQQDPELFNVGRDSFIKSIKTLGLGMLAGPEIRPQLNNENIEHYLKQTDDRTNKRTIDARRERLRRLYERISENMDCYLPQVTGKKVNFIATPVKFGNANIKLDESSEDYLKEFCSNVTGELNQKRLRFYVLGLAGDVKNTKKSWFISAKRAQKTADFLKKQLPKNLPVFCWGAGQGGEWVERDSPADKNAQILIAILQN